MTVSQRNRQIADMVTTRMLDRMRDEVHCVVLFGSVARGKATEKSDIDMYIVAKDCSDTLKRMEAICAEVQSEYGDVAKIHRLFTGIAMFELDALNCRCSRIINTINEGIILYDDGTYESICKEAIATTPEDGPFITKTFD